MGKKYYKAFVEVFDDTFYVDSYTGEGFEKVLAKIDPLLNKEASTMYLQNFGFEDSKSELVIIAIEGIRSFDPDREVKLSTFLIKHISNKKISKIRSENKMSNDAFALFDEQEGTAKIRKARGEIQFSQFKPPQESEGIAFEHTISEEGLPGSDSTIFRDRFEKADFEASLNKICSKLDKKTRKIIELIYFDDLSIKDAADAVGLSGWAASMRLKKLSKRNNFKKIFGIDKNINQDLIDAFGCIPDETLDFEESLEFVDVLRGTE